MVKQLEEIINMQEDKLIEYQKEEDNCSSCEFYGLCGFHKFKTPKERQTCDKKVEKGT